MDRKRIRLGFDDRRVAQLLSRLRRVQYLRDQKRPAEALDACRDVLHQAKGLGIDSSDAIYMAARAALHAGDLESAIRYATDAVIADPLSLGSRQSLDDIADRARERLADLDDRDPAIPRLHELLVRARKADSRSHVAMARYLWRAGRSGAAAELLDAVIRLSPGAREAWKLRGDIAMAEGDADLAARCAAAAAGSSADPSPSQPPLAQA